MEALETFAGTCAVEPESGFGSGAPDRAEGLVELLLAEQGDLTAVERFSQFHREAAEPLQGKYYSALLPATPPGPGQQLAFEVDLDRCSGCKACVTACHSLNGLDEGEAWRDVGTLLGGTADLPILQHVTSSCHHCLEPACLSACPVDAYEKDPVTGIVRHLDDQCFGCQYCTLACPYDAPKFHREKGIVRKCDMCGDRLLAGEAPACVQACPHEAIRIRVVDRAEIEASAAGNEFLPAAPGPGATLPTTRYRTRWPRRGGIVAADEHRLEPEHAHPPLVVMLVLTQMSVGGFALDAVGRLAGLWGPSPLRSWHLGLCLVIGLLGLAASLMHLGRPLYAYRAVIGLRHSWLSREVLAFGGFAKLSTLALVCTVFRPGWSAALAGAAALLGVVGVACSVMVYHVTRRPFWTAAVGGARFAGTTVVAGLATLLVVGSGARLIERSSEPLANERGLWLVLMIATLAKLAVEMRVFNHLRDRELTPLKKTALLLCGPLGGPFALRLVLGGLGGIALPAVLALGGDAIPAPIAALAAAISFVAVVVGELAERFLFFAAVVRPKMPGGIHS